ncbi:hypothetical protein YDYSG_19260 [Paenibacillus tyrfis]|nr:hypothetical protein YDYSG_19260 [Paenibacillus tyrfis]
MGGMSFGDEFVLLAILRGIDVDFLVIEVPKAKVVKSWGPFKTTFQRHYSAKSPSGSFASHEAGASMPSARTTTAVVSVIVIVP